jgi:ribosomal protein S27E
MKAMIKQVSYSPIRDERHYTIMCENGHADYLFEHAYVPDGEIDLDDRQWGEGSSWADLECDECGTFNQERVYPGMVVECPVCGHAEIIPEGFKGEDSLIDDNVH